MIKVMSFEKNSNATILVFHRKYGYILDVMFQWKGSSLAFLGYPCTTSSLPSERFQHTEKCFKITSSKTCV